MSWRTVHRSGGHRPGVIDDGTFVAPARFESEVAAKQNNDRTEHLAWWEAIPPLFTDTER